MGQTWLACGPSFFDRGRSALTPDFPLIALSSTASSNNYLTTPEHAAGERKLFYRSNVGCQPYCRSSCAIEGTKDPILSAVELMELIVLDVEDNLR
jgi:hypothetical protein